MYVCMCMCKQICTYKSVLFNYLVYLNFLDRSLIGLLVLLVALNQNTNYTSSFIKLVTYYMNLECSLKEF